MAITRHPRSCNSCKTATASAEPSFGSVPLPSSSSTIKLYFWACLTIWAILTISPENVESELSISCWSPIREKTWSQIGISHLLAGKNKPNSAIKTLNAIVLIVIVLPPALGPVIISPRVGWPIFTDKGIGLVNKGCRMQFNINLFSAFKSGRNVTISPCSGRTPATINEYFALAKMTSIAIIICIFCLIVGKFSNTSAVSIPRIWNSIAVICDWNFPFCSINFAALFGSI